MASNRFQYGGDECPDEIKKEGISFFLDHPDYLSNNCTFFARQNVNKEAFPDNLEGNIFKAKDERIKDAMPDAFSTGQDIFVFYKDDDKFRSCYTGGSLEALLKKIIAINTRFADPKLSKKENGVCMVAKDHPQILEISSANYKMMISRQPHEIKNVTDYAAAHERNVIDSKLSKNQSNNPQNTSNIPAMTKRFLESQNQNPQKRPRS